MANIFDMEFWIKKGLESPLTLTGEAVVRPGLPSIKVTVLAKTPSGSGDKGGGWGLGVVFMSLAGIGRSGGVSVGF